MLCHVIHFTAILCLEKVAFQFALFITLQSNFTPFRERCCLLPLSYHFLFTFFLLGFLMYWIVHLPPGPCALFSLYLLNTFECAYCIFFELEFKLVGGIITSLASLTASVICLEYSSCCFYGFSCLCSPLV